MKPNTCLEPIKFDESNEKKNPLEFLRRVRGWKNGLKRTRKIFSASMAMIFMAQLTLTNVAWAELPPPTAAELKSTLVPTATLEQSLQDMSTATSPTTTAPTATTSNSFLAVNPLSAPTSVAQMQGKSLYVSKTGSDAGDGSQANPYASIQSAVNQLVAGDTLFIMEGTYQQPAGGAVFNTSGTSDAYITVQGVGNVIIEGTGTTTINGFTVASNYNPAFNTNGQDYLRFNHLTVNNLRAAVTVGPNSSYVEIDGLVADRNHFAVLINSANHVTVRNVVATNSRNGFRVENTGGVVPSDILFENIDVSGSKDVYSGFFTRYRNGDGFITEAGNRITIRNVKSYDNWDGGFDLKATNVLLENVETYGNKNNFKIWGSGIVVKNSLSHDAKVFVGDPVAGEGYGVNNRMGQVTFINTTFANNETADIRSDNDGGPSSTTLQNCIIVRNRASGALYARDGGSMTDSNNLWYDATKAADFPIAASSLFADPRLVSLSAKDYHLQVGSPAIDFGSSAYPISVTDFDDKPRVTGANVDLGAYEYQGLSTPDTVAPVINAVTSASVTATGATINWTTNEASDSQVEYRVQGTSTWLATLVNANRVTNHSMSLSGLSASTVYEYRVKSTDPAGNLATQATVSTLITATPDTTVPVISLITSANVTSTGATISWVTNETSDSQVQYRVLGTTAWLATSVNASFVTNHSVTLSGLVASTVYEYQVKSKDPSGNLAAQATASSLTTTATPPATVDFAGLTEGAVMSGVANIGPNLVSHPDVRKVFYYLNGTQSGKVYAAPFLWGGLTGDGSQGFDTRTLADGNYVLGMGYTDATGDHGAQISFSVRNSITPPADTIAPVISAVTSASVTSTGATISWTTNEAGDSEVQYRAQGATTWLSTVLNTSLATNHSVTLSGLVANTVYEYQVKSKDQAGNLATQATIANLTTTTVILPPTTTCTTAMCGVTAGQIVSGTVMIQPNLTLYPSTRKASYYLNGTQSGKEYAAPFTWGGVNGFDTTKLADGTYTLGVAYTTSTGDKSFSITFTVRNVAPPTVDIVAPVISAVVSSNVTTSGATISWTTNEASDSQIEYRIQGTTAWVVTSVNATLVTNHSMVLSGLSLSSVYEYRVKSKDQAGNLATQATIASVTTTALPTTACTAGICGVTSGQVVSGMMMIQPDLTLNPSIRKVAYYLNGTQYGKVYASPYLWGGVSGDGTTGFDTRMIPNGTYTLGIGYTDSTGDHSMQVIFTVSN